MPSTFSGGSLGRWFEQLCRIQHHQLRDLVITSGEALGPNRLPQMGGVYAFWWTGDLCLLQECNRELVLAGPNRRPVHLHIDDDWLGLMTQQPIPLYVGKTAASIASRIGQHLLLKSIRVLPLGEDATRSQRPTTSCQLRAGVEQLFPDVNDSRTLVLDNVGLSFVSLDGDSHAVNRFYLEDLAIGLMHPPLNVDIER